MGRQSGVVYGAVSRLSPAARHRELRQQFDAALGDIDNDGDIDAFVVNENQRNKIYLNDGSGSFTIIDASTMMRSSRGVENEKKSIFYGI